MGKTNVHLRIRRLLRIAYEHVRLVLYRPFLHHISNSRSRISTERRPQAYAAACITASRNLIHVMSDMKQAAILSGPHWFTTYSVFFATVSLVFYVWERTSDENALEILSNAEQGKRIICFLGHGSMAAARCSSSLSVSTFSLPRQRSTA